MNYPDQNSYDPAQADAHQREKDVRTWGMLLHFSLLAGHALPLAGLAAPIIIWQVKKDELPEIDEHGKIVTNWILTSLIYWMISGILVLVVIGIPMLIVMGIVSTVFPIIGGIKANNGEYWGYPGTFRFF